ncbi:Long chain acyl-CoA synthetase 7 (peroxisomal) [Citrus sinensis]|uniref:Long chain acyl-CoA synthetase 7 (Peroxisomal) n=1 Tax=Citrus sinensis TaxID=2711 RepID=A0ACB8KKX8_CITSI|nr:long chain acyl-CoA synthetase 7, peroxisomal isoform X3 [Citrus x clementina]KAH9755057.1 Long chain acyl-CoA synthetase 7 (peroxisomal) [Citrus sinensis]
MEDSSAQRRFKAVQRHLTSTNTDRCSQLDYNHTTGCFVQSQGYSVRLPEKLQTGKWNVYRSARSPLTLVDRFPDHPEIGTLHDNFIYAVENYPDYKYLGTRVRVDGTVGGYKWMTYGEVSAARKEIGSGLLFHGLQKGVRIGLYLINRPEWLIVDHACSAYSYISVPLYDTLGPDAVKYVVNHAEIEAIFCIPQTLNTLLSFISEIPSVHLIVVVGGKDEHLPSLPSTSGVKLISYLQLQSQGVVLTHGNLISNVAGFSLMVQFYPSDIYMSYLPLAHIYERANQIVSVYYGVAVGFYQGDNLKLMDDLAVLKPTIFPSVPRLYNRIYSGITNAVKASGTLREKLFTAAYNSKKQAIVSGQTPSKMWDRLVFNKIRERLGGRVRFMGSGASPLSPDVMDFLKVCFGCQVMEGYGMTETSCIISAIDKGDNLSGHVGSPNPACEIKLVDVPEMNYTSEDQPHPRGEICVRGPIVFQGYYKNEVQTREVIDGDGWLHTGDIGLWLPGGRLKIIDRKKNIFKLAQGEYVAPEKIENVYAKCKFVLQCFIYGDSFNSCLVAIVAVDPDVLKDWAASQGIKFEDLEQLCNDLRARAAVLAEMNAVGEEGQLRGFEYAKAVTLMPEPFSVENGLLTPTFKIKRPQAKERFAKAISNMYAELATSDQIPQKTSNL